MLTYKQWKKLNESFAGATPLGIAGRPTVGGLIWGEGKKKMLGDDPELPAPKPEDEKMPPVSDEAPEDGDEEDDDDEEGEEKEAPMAKKPPVEDEAEPEAEPEFAPDRPKMMHKDCGKDCDCHKGKEKKCCKKCAKMMTKEENEFFQSLKDMCGQAHFKIKSNGQMVEDALLPPIDPNTGAILKEPSPGDPGYAPQAMGVQESKK